MVPRLYFVFGLIVVSIAAILGAPRAINNEQDLETAVKQFLLKDKAEGLNGRSRRQTEISDMDLGGQEGEAGDGESEGGFFNRAAKFVMDLLQRFLKWINTDTN